VVKGMDVSLYKSAKAIALVEMIFNIEIIEM